MASSPLYQPLIALGIFILHCNCYYCNAFVPPPTSSSAKLLQKQLDTPSPPILSFTTLQALPIDEILTSITTSVVSSASSSHLSSSLLLQSSSTLLSTATATADITASTDDNILTTLLRTPTLWSVLAMTSIVALLVAWEEAIE